MRAPCAAPPAAMTLPQPVPPTLALAVAAARLVGLVAAVVREACLVAASLFLGVETLPKEPSARTLSPPLPEPVRQTPPSEPAVVAVAVAVAILAAAPLPHLVRSDPIYAHRTRHP